MRDPEDDLREVFVERFGCLGRLLFVVCTACIMAPAAGVARSVAGHDPGMFRVTLALIAFVLTGAVFSIPVVFGIELLGNIRWPCKSGEAIRDGLDRTLYRSSEPVTLDLISHNESDTEETATPSPRTGPTRIPNPFDGSE
jgi:hypothetical protein